MKKLRKTKEEKKQIKKFKEEERELQNQIEKEKFKLRKEHIILIFALILLIFLFIVLIYMLFFSENKKAIVPDSPTHENVDVGIVDFDDKGTDFNNLNIKKSRTLKVNYSIISDYYGEGILLSDTKVAYLNNTFIVTSGPTSDDAFISSITKDGKLEWITKLNDKEFGDFKLHKVIFYQDNYYLFGLTKKGKKSNLTVIEVNKLGKRVTTRIIKENINVTVRDVLVTDKIITIIAEGAGYINIYFTNASLAENKKVIDLKEFIPSSQYVYYESSAIIEDIIKIACESNGIHYIVKLNTESFSVDTKQFASVNTLEANNKKKVSTYLKGFTAHVNNTLYKFDSDDRLINKIDYSKVKLEDDKEYKEKYKEDEFIDVEDMKNSIHIASINANTDTIIVNTKTMFSNIYDMYDLNLKIKKRIILDSLKYSYDEGVLLNSFYEDDVIYEIYSYGTETPSIMISKIG